MKKLGVLAAKERLRAAAIAFVEGQTEEGLFSAALQFASASRRRKNSRDAWKRKNRLGERS